MSITNALSSIPNAASSGVNLGESSNQPPDLPGFSSNLLYGVPHGNPGMFNPRYLESISNRAQSIPGLYYSLHQYFDPRLILRARTPEEVIIQSYEQMMENPEQGLLIQTTKPAGLGADDLYGAYNILCNKRPLIPTDPFYLSAAGIIGKVFPPVHRSDRPFPSENLPPHLQFITPSPNPISQGGNPSSTQSASYLPAPRAVAPRHVGPAQQPTWRQTLSSLFGGGNKR